MDITNAPDFTKDPNAVLSDQTEWANGSSPDYSLVNELYEKEKTMNHPAGSLEELIQNLVKNWEREASHKKNITECRTMDLTNFKFGVNGNWISAAELAEQGNYNALIGESEYYAASRVPSSHESHAIFRSGFKSGFAWELLEVFSGPPKAAFKWRHWGKVDGPMRCPARSGKDILIESGNKTVEIFGITVVDLDQQFRVTSMETFWNADEMFKQIVN